jgi:hypothetical protein
MHTVKTLLAVAGVALLAAGCGSSSHNPSTGTNAQSPQSFASTAYKHAACMRSHGVPNFPDPQVTTSGNQVSIRQVLPQSVANSPQFSAADKACRGLVPGLQNGSPAQQAAQQHAHAQALLAFAQCLRGHGLQGFPDPTAQGQLTLEMVHAAGVDLQAPSFLTAAKACVGVTHGAITLAQVEQAIQHTGAAQSTGGAQ